MRSLNCRNKLTGCHARVCKILIVEVSWSYSILCSLFIHLWFWVSKIGDDVFSNICYFGMVFHNEIKLSLTLSFHSAFLNRSNLFLAHYLLAFRACYCKCQILSWSFRIWMMSSQLLLLIQSENEFNWHIPSFYFFLIKLSLL